MFYLLTGGEEWT